MPFGQNDCARRITADELAYQAHRRPTGTLEEWWLTLAYELRERVGDDAMTELLRVAFLEPPFSESAA
jgi:hypothetical protein